MLRLCSESSGQEPEQARYAPDDEVVPMIPLLIGIDVVCLIVALLTAHAVRFGFLPDLNYLTGVLVAAFVWPMAFYALGLYSPQRLSPSVELRRTTAAVAIGTGLLIVVTIWSDLYVSRSWIALTFAIALALEVTTRLIVRTTARPRAPSSSGLTSGP